MRMSNLRRCACVLFLVFFLIGLVTFQVGAVEAEKQGSAGSGTGKQQKEPAPSAEQPRISFDASSYDAGEVWEGDVVSHDFIVKNTGTAELAIKSVKPG